MAYLLDRLEALASDFNNAERCPLSVDQDNRRPSDLSQEIDSIPLKIKEKLLRKSSKTISPGKLSNLIRFYQSSMIRLLDEMVKKECTCTARQDCALTNLPKLIDQLTETLIFIHQQFEEYFDTKMRLPLICQSKHRELIRGRSRQLIDHLARLNLPPELVLILTHPFTDFVNQKKTFYTFNDKHFIYGWLERLELPHLLYISEENNFEVFCRQMLAFNLNSEECIDFFVKFMTDKYLAEESKADQLSMLRHFQKCIGQTARVNASGYCLDKPSLQEVLTNWVTLEMNYIENTCHINEQTHTQLSQEVTAPAKIPTNLSVSKLACVLRVWVESGIFPETNSNELITLFANHFTTPRTNQISFNSLYNKFYSLEKSALEDIKIMSLNQFKLLHENKI